jgi:hypothetical protein
MHLMWWGRGAIGGVSCAVVGVGCFGLAWVLNPDQSLSVLDFNWQLARRVGLLFSIGMGATISSATSRSRMLGITVASGTYGLLSVLVPSETRSIYDVMVPWSCLYGVLIGIGFWASGPTWVWSALVGAVQGALAGCVLGWTLKVSVLVLTSPILSMFDAYLHGDISLEEFMPVWEGYFSRAGAIACGLGGAILWFAVSSPLLALLLPTRWPGRVLRK